MDEERSMMSAGIARTVGGSDGSVCSSIGDPGSNKEDPPGGMAHQRHVTDQAPMLAVDSIKQEIPPLESIGCSWDSNHNSHPPSQSTELSSKRRKTIAQLTGSQITQYRKQPPQQQQHHHHQHQQPNYHQTRHHQSQFTHHQPFHQPSHHHASHPHKNGFLPTTPSTAGSSGNPSMNSPSSLGVSPASSGGVASSLGGYTTVSDPMMQSNSFLPPRVDTTADCSLINEAGSSAASAIGRPASAGPTPVSQSFYDPGYAGQPPPAPMGHCFGSSMMPQFNPMFGALGPMNFCTAPSMFWSDNSGLSMMGGLDNPMYENSGEHKSEEKSEDNSAAPESPNSSQGILDVDAVINGSRHGSVDHTSRDQHHHIQHDPSSSVNRSRKRSRQESEEEVAGSIGGGTGSNATAHTHGSAASMPGSSSFIGGGFDCMGSYPLGFGPPLCAPGGSAAPMTANPFYCSSLIPPNPGGNAAGTSADISGYGAAAAVMAAGGMGAYSGSLDSCNGAGQTAAGHSSTNHSSLGVGNGNGNGCSANGGRRNRNRDGSRRMSQKKRRGSGGGCEKLLTNEEDSCSGGVGEGGASGASCSGSGSGSVGAGSSQGYGADEEAGIHSPFPNSYVDSAKESEFARSSNVLFTQYCHARNSLYSQYVANSHAVKAMRLSIEDRQRYLTQFEVDAKIQERRYFNHFYALSKNQASPLTGVSLVHPHPPPPNPELSHHRNHHHSSSVSSSSITASSEDEKTDDGTLNLNAAIEGTATEDLSHHDGINELPKSEVMSAVGSQSSSCQTGLSSSSNSNSGSNTGNSSGGISESTLMRIGEYEKTERLKNRKKRTKKPKFSEFDVRVFADWYNMHLDNPYPSKQEKEMMAELTGLTKYQVSRWFCNARTRRPPPQRYESSKDGSLQPSQIPPQIGGGAGESSPSQSGANNRPNVLPKG